MFASTNHSVCTSPRCTPYPSAAADVEVPAVAGEHPRQEVVRPEQHGGEHERRDGGGAERPRGAGPAPRRRRPPRQMSHATGSSVTPRSAS